MVSIKGTTFLSWTNSHFFKCHIQYVKTNLGFSFVSCENKLTLSLGLSWPTFSKSLKSTNNSFGLQLFLLHIFIIIVVVVVFQ